MHLKTRDTIRKFPHLRYGKTWLELHRREDTDKSVVVFWDAESEVDSSLPVCHVVVFGSDGEKKFSIPCDTGEQAMLAFRHPYGVANSILTSGKVAA